MSPRFVVYPHERLCVSTSPYSILDHEGALVPLKMLGQDQADVMQTRRQIEALSWLCCAEAHELIT